MSPSRPAGDSGHPDLEALAGQLRALLFQWREVHPAHHVYLLLDPNHPVADHHPLHPSQLKARAVRRHLQPVNRPDLSHEPDALPLLLQFHVAGENGYVDEALLELSLHCALQRCRSVNGAYVAGWLSSDLAPEALASRLARQGVMFSVGEGRQRFMPLFEPYRLGLLAGDDEAAAFLARWKHPVRHWVFVDAAGALRSVGGGSGSDSRAGPDGAPAAARLSRPQFAAQERVGVARFVVLALERAGVLIGAEPERRIDRVIEKAHGHGLRETEDVVFHALNSFTLGPAWDQHPAALALIREVAAAHDGIGPRLAERVSQLPDAVLEEISRATASRH